MMLRCHTLRLCLAGLMCTSLSSLWAGDPVLNMGVLPKQTLYGPGQAPQPNPLLKNETLPTQGQAVNPSNISNASNNSNVQDSTDLCHVFIPSTRLLVTKCAPPTTGLRATPIAADYAQNAGTRPNTKSSNAQTPAAQWVNPQR